MNSQNLYKRKNIFFSYYSECFQKDNKKKRFVNKKIN